MSDSEKNSSDYWLPSTPPDIKEAAENAKNDLLPTKSKKNYESAYETFVQWKREHKTKSTSESIVLAYFKEMSKKYKPTTLWSMYSKLKSMLKIEENVDIDKYHAFKAFVKKQSTGFTSKKSNVLSSENVKKFLSEAPDDEYLATKVALIFGITGACRNHELVDMKLKDITRQGDSLIVNVPIAKTKKSRTFVIAEEFVEIVRKYTDLRPEHARTDRFFLNFRKGKCTTQVIGIHKFAKMPSEIATYLKLDDPKKYTGHAFRRTSKTLLADSGANITTLRHHGGWKSSTVVEGYIEESIKNKSTIGNVVSTAVNFPSAEPSKENTDAPPPEYKKIETITVERENSNLQLNVDGNQYSATKLNFIFNNCTVVINQN